MGKEQLLFVAAQFASACHCTLCEFPHLCMCCAFSLFSFLSTDIFACLCKPTFVCWLVCTCCQAQTTHHQGPCSTSCTKSSSVPPQYRLFIFVLNARMYLLKLVFVQIAKYIQTTHDPGSWMSRRGGKQLRPNIDFLPCCCCWWDRSLCQTKPLEEGAEEGWLRGLNLSPPPDRYTFRQRSEAARRLRLWWIQKLIVLVGCLRVGGSWEWSLGGNKREGEKEGRSRGIPPTGAHHRKSLSILWAMIWAI